MCINHKSGHCQIKKLVVSAAMHGSVAWVYGTTVQRAINGWNASMLSTITDRSVQQECSSPTIALVERLVCRQVRAVG